MSRLVRPYSSIAILLIFAFLLRYIGNGFGLPDFLIHSDENEYVSAVKSIVDKTPSPYKIGLPVSSFYYVLAAVYMFFREYINNSERIEDFFIFGRTFSALLSTGTVALWYLSLRNYFNHRYALIAALWLSVFFIDVQIAHYIKEDVYIQFFGAASIYFLSRAYTCKKNTWVHICAAIIAAVLAGSAKISGFFYCIPVGLYLLLPQYFQRKPNNATFNKKHAAMLLLLVSLTFISFHLNTPISFMESDASKKYSLEALLKPEHEHLVMSSNKDGIPNVIFWPLYLFTTGIGPIPFILTLIGAGIIYKDRTKHQHILPLLTMAGCYLLVLLIQYDRFDRWITVITPVIAYTCAVATIHLHRVSKYAAFTLIIGFLLTLTPSLLFAHSLRAPDSREAASDYLQKMDKKNIILFIPGLDPVKHQLARSGTVVGDVPCPPATSSRYRGMYIVVNETISTLQKRFLYSQDYQEQASCVSKMIENAQRIATFEGKRVQKRMQGMEMLTGPATANYLHSPKIGIFKIEAGPLTISEVFMPDKLFGMSNGMELEKNYITSRKGESAFVHGPYAILPKGTYTVSIEYSYSADNMSSTRDVLTYVPFAESVGELDTPDTVTTRTTQNARHTLTRSFRTETPIQLQTRLTITPNAVVHIYAIRITSTDSINTPSQ